MKSALGRSVLWGSALVFISAAAVAQTKSDFGKQLYDTHCAVCHGISGKGDGPYKPLLVKPPSDLTSLAKRNNGVFPISRLYDVIDGRLEVLVHGPREMPVWGGGNYFKPAEPPMEQVSGEMFVRVRILALIDYINRMQVK